jgi:YfiR/HmsC-like
MNTLPKLRRGIQVDGTWVILLLAFLCGPNRCSAAETPSLTEYQVKALCLLNFAKYIEWPAQTFAASNSPIKVGIFGENKFGDDLKIAMQGKCIGERPIEIKAVSSEPEWRNCQVLFISESENKREAGILNRVKSLPILTVGESEEFLAEGGVVRFLLKDGKVRFEVNLNAARTARLGISSKMLSLADTVQGKR